MTKKYEVMRDGLLEQSFEKCREGMNDAIGLVEQLVVDWSDDFDTIEIVCTEYNAKGDIVSCEQVQEFQDDSLENDMTDAVISTDEDYGDEVSPMGIWG